MKTLTLKLATDKKTYEVNCVLDDDTKAISDKQLREIFMKRMGEALERQVHPERYTKQKTPKS